MSRNKKRLMIGLLAMVMFALTGLSTLQATVTAEMTEVELMPTEGVAYGNFCNNVFIQCGGFLVCPSGCHCSSGLCFNN